MKNTKLKSLTRPSEAKGTFTNFMILGGLRKEIKCVTIRSFLPQVVFIGKMHIWF